MMFHHRPRKAKPKKGQHVHVWVSIGRGISRGYRCTSCAATTANYQDGSGNRG